jgi:T5SS/PEP-CTERM-associated repeat protein
MALYQYVPGSSDIGSASNWINTVTDMPGVPGPNDQGVINAGTLFSGSLDIGVLTVVDAGAQFNGATIDAGSIVLAGSMAFAGGFVEPTTLDVTGTSDVTVRDFGYLGIYGGSNPGLLAIGSAQNDAATLDLDGGDFYMQSGRISLGGTSSAGGTLLVDNGAQFSSYQAPLLIGDAAGARGSVVVDGAHTAMNVDGAYTAVGNDGTGALTVSGGAYASFSVASELDVGVGGGGGTLTVTGAGSTLVTGNFNLGAGQASTPEAAVLAGGTLTADVNVDLEQGTLTVSGRGSEFSARNITMSENNGVPVLKVGTGGTVAWAEYFLQNEGTIVMQGGTLSGRGSLTMYGDMTGRGTISAESVFTEGRIAALGGTLRITTELDGDGRLLIGRAGSLELDGKSEMGVAFQAGGQALLLGDAADFTQMITGFGAGESVDLLKDPATALAVKAAGTHTDVTVKSGTSTIATLRFAGTYAAANFTLASDGHGGSTIGYHAVT